MVIEATTERPSRELELGLLWKREIGLSQIERKRVVFAGEEGEKIPVLYTVVRALPGANFGVVYDEKLVKEGMVAGPGGLLINQEATASHWGRAAGRFPKEFIESLPEGTVGVCPSNFGWQKGAFLIERGQLILIENDRGEISGKFGVIGCRQNVWETTEVELKDGKVVSPAGLKGITGFSIPLILKDGKVVSLEEIISDPRLMGDLRNVFDFGPVEGVPGEFWGLLRDFLPTMAIAGKRLAKGKPAGTAIRGLDEDKVAKFKAIIEGNENLRKLIEIKSPKSGLTIMVIKDKLPLNRIPVVGVGFGQEGKLIVIAADGRQEGSAGLTIEELAELMRQEGAVTAGLGCAGGDVAVVAKTDKEGFEILNSPSSKDHKTRPVPSVLTISPRHE